MTEHCTGFKLYVSNNNLLSWEDKSIALRCSESITWRPAGGLNTAMQAEPPNSVLPIRLLAWVALLHMRWARRLVKHSRNVLVFFLDQRYEIKNKIKLSGRRSGGEIRTQFLLFTRRRGNLTQKNVTVSKQRGRIINKSCIVCPLLRSPIDTKHNVASQPKPKSWGSLQSD